MTMVLGFQFRVCGAQRRGFRLLGPVRAPRLRGMTYVLSGLSGLRDAAPRAKFGPGDFTAQQSRSHEAPPTR